MVMSEERRSLKIALTVIVVGVFLLLTVLNVLSHYWNSQQNLGYVLDLSEREVRIAAVLEGGPAEKAGLQRGDRITAVNGRAVDGGRRYLEMERSFWRRDNIIIRLNRQGEVLSFSFPYVERVSWQTILPSVFIICLYLPVGLLSFWKNSRDLRVRLLFLLTVLASLSVIISDYFTSHPDILSQCMVVLLYGAFGLLIGVEPHLALVIPKPKNILQKFPGLPYVFYASGLLVCILALTGYFNAVYSLEIPFLTLRTVLPAYIFVYNLVTPCMVFGFLVHTYLRSQSGVEKAQTRIVLLGLLPWTVSMILAAFFWIFRGGLTPALFYFNLFAIIPVPFAFAVAIFRYRMFNVALVIRKSLIYGLLTGLILLVYYGIIGLGGGLFSAFFIKGGSIWMISFATLLLGILFNPVRKKIQFVVDKFFYPEKFNLRRELPDLSKDIASLAALKDLAPAISRRLTGLLNMESAAFILSDENKEKYIVFSTYGVIQEQGLEKKLIFYADDPVMVRFREDKRPFLLEQLPYEVANTPGFAKLKELGARLAVPFILKNDLIAVLLLGIREGEVKIDREDRNLLAIFANQAAAMVENARLFQYATYDDLTGLFRRHVFEKELEKEMERARRFERPFTVGICDIDFFKKINDTWGHPAGDVVLKHVAGVLKSHLRSIDCLARFGGEEFVFFLPETPPVYGREIGEKLRMKTASMRIPIGSSSSHPAVTVSVGLTGCEKGPGGFAMKDFLDTADRALYLAKKNGRNRTEIMPLS